MAAHHLTTRDQAGLDGTSNGAFLRHVLEMLAAMIVGMMILGGIVSGVFALLGHSNLLHYAALRAMLMATYMTMGMTLWMRHRRHAWRRVSEMALAMFLPFALLLGPFWAGVISGQALLAGGHLLMLPSMLGVMVVNRAEYSRRHHGGGIGVGAHDMHQGAGFAK